MANVNITVYYDPTNPSNPWSLSTDGGPPVSGDSVVHLKERGNTTLRWTIQFGPNVVVADATIAFSTDASRPGIQFTGTPPWPGTAPNGNANNWNASLNNEQSGAKFYFKVNAVYTVNGAAQPVTWDPEVEEDPPRSAATVAV